MLPNLSPSPNLYKVQSVYNNNVGLYMCARYTYNVYVYTAETTNPWSGALSEALSRRVLRSPLTVSSMTR